MPAVPVPELEIGLISFHKSSAAAEPRPDQLAGLLHRSQKLLEDAQSSPAKTTMRTEWGKFGENQWHLP